MRSRLLVAVLIAGAGTLMMSGRADAHHSFAATYLENETVTIEGDVTEFLFRNPHSFIRVVVKGHEGQEVRWAIEGAAGQQFSRQGVEHDTLKPGDHVIITGHPGRESDDHRMRLMTVSRPSDGWKWGGDVD